MSKIGKVEIEWKAKKYEAAVKANVAEAIDAAADFLIKKTKQALSGEGQSKLEAAGLKKGDFAKGRAQISGLKEHKVGRTKVIYFGGVLEALGKDGKKETLERIYWNEAADRWVQSSPPGTPPYMQTGELRRSIDKDPSPDGLEVRVGPKDRLVYGRIQELGGSTKKSTLPARPYLGPSFQACLPTIEKLVAHAVAHAGTTL